MRKYRQRTVYETLWGSRDRVYENRTHLAGEIVGEDGDFIVRAPATPGEAVHNVPPGRRHVSWSCLWNKDAFAHLLKGQILPLVIAPVEAGAKSTRLGSGDSRRWLCFYDLKDQSRRVIDHEGKTVQLRDMERMFGFVLPGFGTVQKVYERAKTLNEITPYAEMGSGSIGARRRG